MGKGSFILYDDDLEAVGFLNQEQKGKLFDALLRYRLYGEDMNFDDDVAVKILFHQLKVHITINEKKYEEVCKKKSESAKKRWQAINEAQTLSQDKAFKSCIKESKSECIIDNDNDNENENDNVNDIVNDCVIDNEKSAEQKMPAQENTHKKEYGLYKNIGLTDKEYSDLHKAFPQKADKLIDSMSAYVKTSGKTYRDCYTRLLTWTLYDDPKDKSSVPTLLRDEPSYDADAFMRKAIGLKYKKRDTS